MVFVFVSLGLLVLFIVVVKAFKLERATLVELPAVSIFVSLGNFFFAVMVGVVADIYTNSVISSCKQPQPSGMHDAFV